MLIYYNSMKEHTHNLQNSSPADLNKILLNNYYFVTIIKWNITKHFCQVVLVAKGEKGRAYL